MSRRIRWSLSAKIIAWSFVPAVIILVAAALTVFSAYERVTQDLVVERDRERARRSAGQLADKLDEYSAILMNWTRSAIGYENGVEPHQDAFKRAGNQFAVFDAGVLLIEADGTVVAAQPPRRDVVEANWSNRSYFREMAYSLRPVFSDVVMDGPDETPVVVVTVPILGPRAELQGAVAGMFRLGSTAVSSFYGSIVKLHTGEDESIFLVDRTGRVIYHTDMERIGADFSAQEDVKQVLSGTASAFRARDWAGNQIVASFAPVPGTSWGLVIESDWSALLRATQGYRGLLLALLALGVIIPAAVVAIGVRRITRPISELIDAAKEVAGGNFGHVVGVSTSDEVAELVKQFNLMSTELQASYSALQAREQRLALVIQGTHDGIWDWDLETDDVYFSPRWKQVLGYEDGDLPNRFESWRDLLHPEDVEPALAALQAYLDGDTPYYQGEQRLRHKDGTYRWVLARGIGLRDAEGRVVRMAGSHTDIHDRKQAEEALRRSEERFSLAMEGANDGVWDWDLKSGEVYYSPRWKAMLGYSEGEVEPFVTAWDRLTHPDDQSRAWRLIEAFVAGRVDKYEIEFRMRHKDGSYRDILSRAFGVREGPREPVVRLVGTHVDITERKKAEEALRESEAKFRGIVEFANVGIAIIQDGRFKFVNVHYADTLGYTVEELLGTQFTDYAAPEECDRVRSIYERRLRGEAVPTRYETVIVNKQGQRVYLDVSAGLVPYEGRPATFDFFHDITKRKQAEQELRRQNEYLAALHDTALGIVGRLDVDELLEAIAIRASNLVTESAGWLYLVDTSTDKLVLRIGTGHLRDKIGTRLRRGEGLAGEVWQSDRPLTVEDYDAWDGRSERYHDTDLNRVTAAPLHSGRQVVGVLGLARPCSAPAFRRDEVDVVVRLAQLASIALDNAQLYSSVQKQLIELKRAEEALHDRLSFEKLITSISTDFINLGPADVDAGIEQALRTIGEFTESDRSYVFLFSPDGTTLDNTHEWCRSGIRPLRPLYQAQPVDVLPWTTACLKQLHTVHIPSLLAAPPEAAVDRARCLSHSPPTRSILLVPMIYLGKAVGFLGFDAVRTEKTWSEDSIALLRIVGEIFVNALEHKRAQQALHSAYQTLEQRVEERTHELGALNAISAVVNRSLDLTEIMGAALIKTIEAVGLDGGLAFCVEMGSGEQPQNPSLGVIAHCGISPEFLRQLGPLYLEGSVVQAATTSEQPVIWSVAGHPNAPLREALEAEGVGFGVSVPLMAKGILVGGFVLVGHSVRSLAPEELTLLAAIGQQVGVAIENANLYRAEQERRAEAERRRLVAEGLREIMAVLNSKQSLQETLNFIAAQTCRVLGSDAAAIFRLDEAEDKLRIQAACGLKEDYIAGLRLSYGEGAAGQALRERRPVLLADNAVSIREMLRSDNPPSPAQQTLMRWLAERYRSLMGVPLVVRDEAYGAITLYYHKCPDLSEEAIRLAQTMADQVALAIETARLREQAEQSAAMAERARLARELHDSVTQALYSVTLYAEASARLLVAGEHLAAAEHLRELRDTAQEALREMRLLIFELRPLALEKSGLLAALQARLDAVEGRGGTQAELRLEGSEGLESLPVILQQELYQIAQEALNNVLKHARARRVQVSLRHLEKSVQLEVCDDGMGFVPEIVGERGGLGLAGMRERVQRIGGTLHIASAPGEGAKVRVEVPIGGIK